MLRSGGDQPEAGHFAGGRAEKGTEDQPCRLTDSTDQPLGQSGNLPSQEAAVPCPELTPAAVPRLDLTLEAVQLAEKLAGQVTSPRHCTTHLRHLGNHGTQLFPNQKC